MQIAMKPHATHTTASWVRAYINTLASGACRGDTAGSAARARGLAAAFACDRRTRTVRPRMVRGSVRTIR